MVEGIFIIGTLGKERDWGAAIMSIRLHFIVEGQTEETFVNRVLIPHLANYSVWGDARQVMTSKRNYEFRRGGLKHYNIAKNDIVLWMKEDNNIDARFTTMFDVYALPTDFPEYDNCKHIRDPYKRVKILEERFFTDIDNQYFIPYLQLHEFEALVLSDPSQLLTQFDGYDREINNLVNMVSRIDSPELINDGKDTAPSKRIIKEIPEYKGRKASLGPILAEKIGLTILRERCDHFNQWLLKCESLTNN